MQNGLFRKSLVCAILVLFIGISIMPIAGSLSIERVSTDNQMQKSYLGDDTTPPVTTCTINPPEPNGLNGWYVSDVEVTLNATDDMSGVNRTEYRINGGSIEMYIEPFNVTVDGELMVEYRSIDYAGNVEDWKSVEFKIDQTPPIIDLTVEIIDLDVIFTATCFDISGVDRVEFYIEDELMFTDFESPFQWIPTQPDICPLKVIAYDIAGNSDNEDSSASLPHFYHVFGFIFPPQFSATCISFRAVLVFRRWTIISPDGPGGHWLPSSVRIVSTYLLNHYTGHIGKFFIHATFNNGQCY